MVGSPIGRQNAIVAAVLLAILGLRSYRLDQPIFENYLGRQIPTAMVARNLDRGSGFLHPQLDTGPFPNLFLVEPPLYAFAVVAARRVGGLSIESSGRLVSAIGTTIGAWGLFGLARRREGFRAALTALLAYGAFPITIRYGRACQPDALALAALIAGLDLWDRAEFGCSKPARAAILRISGTIVLALAMALKAIFTPIALVCALAIFRPVRPWKMLALGVSIVPTALWYAWAAWLLRENSGSRASLDNAAIWAGALVPAAALKGDFYATAARFLLFRCFSTAGIALAALGWFRPKGRDRLWTAWAASAAVFLMAFAGKAHHEYYWWTLAPAVAVGFGRGWEWLCGLRAIGGPIRLACLGLVIVSMLVQARSTWTTPPEWSGLRRDRLASRLPNAPGLVVAPEPLIFSLDVRGCRLEFDPRGVRRAAGEWGGSVPSGRALDLVGFYRDRGARYFADVAPIEGETSGRRALHEEIRKRYRVLVDRDILVADLGSAGGAEDAPR